MSFRQSENQAAFDYYQQALPLYEKMGALLGKANCLKSLGDLSFRQSENQAAFDYYQQALPLYEKMGALLGKANCLKSLGDLSFRQSENQAAFDYTKKWGTCWATLSSKLCHFVNFEKRLCLFTKKLGTCWAKPTV
ncbi:MAG: tetratricopeptide repeat protein [Spirosomataceae bacterium]